jgi:hypothetical protein
MYDSSVYINANVEFDAILPFVFSFDTDVVPCATVAGTKTRAVNSYIHTMSSEKPGDLVRHLPDIFDGEFMHTLMNDTVTRYVIEKGFECFTFLKICFDAVIGLVESYFKDATSCYLLWIMSFSCTVL